MVVLNVNDPRLPKKKRIAGAPRLFLIPYDGQLLVALEGYGFEVVDPAMLKSISISRVGINMTLSRALAQAIQSVLNQGVGHGNQSP